MFYNNTKFIVADDVQTFAPLYYTAAKRQQKVLSHAS